MAPYTPVTTNVDKPHPLGHWLHPQSLQWLIKNGCGHRNFVAYQRTSILFCCYRATLQNVLIRHCSVVLHLVLQVRSYLHLVFPVLNNSIFTPFLLKLLLFEDPFSVFVTCVHVYVYCLTGNFWDLANFRNVTKLKNHPTLHYCIMRMRSVSVIAKLKPRQYVQKTDLQNLECLPNFPA